LAQKVLVTGSEGSLMQWVIPRLKAHGFEVVGVDLEEKNSKIDYEYFKFDLRVHEPCIALLTSHKSFDAVIQSAANIYGVGGFNKYCADILIWDTSIQAHVLELALGYDIPLFINLSSSMVYENCIQNPNYPVSEEMPDYAPAPATEYGLSKLVGERMVKAAAKQHGLKYVNWRPFNIITPFEEAGKYVGMAHVFADYIRHIVKRREIELPIIGDGEQIRCFTWIGDVAEAIANYSFHEKAVNETFNIGRAEPISMKNLARLIKELAESQGLRKTSGPLQFRTIDNYPNDVRVRIPNVNKMKTVLGWEATIPLVTSIKFCLNKVKDDRTPKIIQEETSSH
jgi:UDP-glucose 4-epimerase